jgi:hypothetical protein
MHAPALFRNGQGTPHPHIRNINIFGASRATVLWSSSRAMAEPTCSTGQRVKLPPDTCTLCPCLPSTEAKRRGQAEHSLERGSGVSPDYDSPTRAHAEDCQAERRGQAERSEEVGVGGLPRLRHRPPPTTTQHSTPTGWVGIWRCIRLLGAQQV